MQVHLIIGIAGCFASTLLTAMGDLPHSDDINVKLLGQVFNNTVATYKFYWFLSILELYSQTGRTTLSFRDIICQMICQAWYPVHYFRLSFGVSDLLVQQCRELQSVRALRIDIKRDALQNELITAYEADSSIHTHILNFGRNVPHWFMSPWFPKCSENDIIRLSQSFTNNCPYAIYKTPDKFIVLNPAWLNYLRDNLGVLRDFCYWNLALFLQRRNPNVPDIPHKLFAPLERNSLVQQRKYWNTIFEEVGSIPCIYTGKPLSRNDFDLDHFMPWSFVAHDLLWNLLPCDSSVNSSKSNHLPSLEKYLPAFAQAQQQGLRTFAQLHPDNRLLEDYLQLGASVSELISMPPDTFQGLYRKAMTPLYQIAETMGFTRWTL